MTKSQKPEPTKKSDEAQAALTAAEVEAEAKKQRAIESQKKEIVVEE